MPTHPMRASAPPANPRSSAHNFNIVAIALTAALVALQLVGLSILERSHAHAMHASSVHEAAVCLDGGGADVPQLPTD